MKQRCLLLLTGVLLAIQAGAQTSQVLISTNADWRYFKGTSEASTPTNAWREVGFDDSTWATAVAPFHYGTNTVGGDDEETGGTILSDMPGSYGCVFLRQTFVVANTNAVIDLTLGFLIDDGLVAWINGKEVRVAGARRDNYAYTDTAQSSREANYFYQYSILGSAMEALKNGTNVLCVQAFNYNAADSDFRVDAQLVASITDVNPPVITEVSPTPGATVSTLNAITVTFDEPVIGVLPQDFLVNGIPSASVTGSGNVYTYHFIQPTPGTVHVQWAVGHTLEDANGNRFDETAPEAQWDYTLLDVIAPTLVTIIPSAPATVVSLSQIQVEFSEPVLGVDAGDLLINGEAALGVTPVGNQGYLFEFAEIDHGTATVTWNPNHNITDTASPPNAFVATGWNYVVLPSAEPVQVIVPTDADWRYFKGTSEASNPTNAWRDTEFTDSAWLTGVGPFHFGTNPQGGDDELTGGTILSDMRNNYSCVFLRKSFEVDTNGVLDMELHVRADDGYVVWLNGEYIYYRNVAYPIRLGFDGHATVPLQEGFNEDISIPLAMFKPGPNVLAVQAFNWLKTDSDFRFSAELRAYYPDIVGPRVVLVDPAPGRTVTNLISVTVVFDEDVAGVVADDFLINGTPAVSVSGATNRYTYFFTQPPAGRVELRWDTDHSMTDTNGNRFDETAASALWEYQMVDATPPFLTSVIPATNTTLASLTQIQVAFSEPVSGVDASDLRINGQAALGVVPISATTFRFDFAATAEGTADVTWNSTHGITDQAAAPNAFEATGWSYNVDSNAVGDVIINEFSAAWFQDTVLTDEDGDPNDWIELYNRGTNSVSLLGWSLSTDPQDPAMWEFPEVTLAAGQYLVVFASGKDRKPATPGGELHTNFRLNDFGEYLGLYPPGLPHVAASDSDFAPQFPEQRENISYGYTTGGALVYFPTDAVTPGSENPMSPSFIGLVEEPAASVDSGFFDRSFYVVLSSKTPGATVRYTLDGSSPESSGILYTGPILISGNAAKGSVVLRAAAQKAGWLSSRTLTRTYIFPAYVISQPIVPTGFPPYWQSAERNDIPGDYEMDPQVLTDSALQLEAQQALTNIPTISIVSDLSLLLGTNTGFYVRKIKKGYQVPINVEMIMADGSAGFNVPGGIEVQGGTSPDDATINGVATWKSIKLSMRILFKGEFGNRKLHFPVFPDSPNTEYNTLMLDAGLNNWWHYNGSTSDEQRTRATCIHDQWASDLQKAMGGISFHGRAVHVYLDGVYWGMYVMHERPDDNFAASYFGGDSDEYDVLKHTSTTVVSGDPSHAAYDQMLSRVRAGLANNANYEAVGAVIDLPWFADYMLLNFYIGNEDWAQHNWYAARRRATGEKWRFFSYDAEHILEHMTRDSTGLNNSGAPTEIYQDLLANTEFKLLFADRVYRNFFKKDGPYYVDPANPVWDAAHPERNHPADYFMRRVNEIWASLLCESARWGDSATVRANSPLLRDRDYVQQLDCLMGWAYHANDNHGDVWNTTLNTGYFPSRGQVLLGQLRARGAYPNIDPPVFNSDGGRVTAGTTLFMTNVQATGTIYYTTDGSDPRVYGAGTVSATALAYASGTPIVLNDTQVIKARLLDGTTWSALNESTFTVGQLGVPLCISEIM